MMTGFAQLMKRDQWLTDSNRPVVRALVFSQVMALVFWAMALWVRGLGVLVWYDQAAFFLPSVSAFTNPYQFGGFVHIPWVVVLLAPFSLLPLELATLLQSCLLFGLITLVIFKFGGDMRAVVLTLTSFVAMDAIIEMNVDWGVIIGLLVPVQYSLPFLLIKPQLALGYYFGVPPRRWLPTILVGAVVVALSFLIWGFWFQKIAAAVPTVSIERSFNIAPLHLLPWPVSIAIGVVLAYLAYKRQDPAIGIIAWFFFTPYIAFYALLLLFGIIAVRLQKLALIIHICTWIVYGGVVVLSLLNRG